MSVYLKVPKVSELHFRKEWMADPKTMSYNAGYGISDPSYDYKTGTITKTSEELISWFNDWTSNNDRYFAYIYDSEITEPIGEIYYYKSEGLYNMGIVIDYKYRGRGYSYYALLELEKVAFINNNISELSDVIPNERVSAIKAFKKAGFSEIGRTKEAIKFGKIEECVELLLRKEEYIKERNPNR